MTGQKKGAPLEEARLYKRQEANNPIDSSAKGEKSNAVSRKLSAPPAPSSVGFFNFNLLGAHVKR